MSDQEKTPNSGQYYIRVRGKVLGPFTVEKLKALRSRGQFSRVHEVSTDRQSWQPASTLDRLIGPPSPLRGGSQVVVLEGPGPMASAVAGDVTLGPPPAAFPAAVPGASWHYNIAGEQHGPVSIMELRSMLGAGKLRPDDFVWKDGMPDWMPISHIPELQPPPASALSAGAGFAPLHDNGVHRTSGLAVASLVMGLVGLVTPFFVFNLLAMIFGVAALKAIARSRVILGGRGMALSGLILGIVGLLFWTLALLFWFGLPQIP